MIAPSFSRLDVQCSERKSICTAKSFASSLPDGSRAELLIGNRNKSQSMLREVNVALKNLLTVKKIEWDRGFEQARTNPIT